MNRDELIKVYLDTQEKGEKYPEPKTYKIDFHDIKMIKPTGNKANISIVNQDSVSALVANPGKTLVLNMASSIHPGGGVAKGSKAQEESLFRCSNLYHISRDFYPLEENEALITENVTFFKDFYYNDMEPVTADVITIAAPNVSFRPSYINTKEYEYEILYKIRLMISQKYDTIILGAWGCGVFGNNPDTIAKYFVDTIKKTSITANKIVFPIINDHNSVGNNFTSFDAVIKNNK